MDASAPSSAVALRLTPIFAADLTFFPAAGEQRMLMTILDHKARHGS